MTVEAQQRPLVYGMVPDARPTTFLDASGKPTGFFVELYTRIMDELGIAYRFQIADFTEMYNGLLSGDVDLFTALQKTPEREELFVFPDSGVVAGWSQLFVAHGTLLQSVLDLQHRKIGVVENDRNGINFRSYIESLAIECEIVEYRTFEELLRAVETGDVFGGVQSNALVGTEPRISATLIVFAPFKAYPVLSRKSTLTAEFARIMSRYDELIADSNSYYYELQKKWFSTERTETVVTPRWLVVLLVVLLVSSLMATIVIQLLSRKLRQSNQELERKVAERTELLVRSEKMATLGTLVAGIAHEFNTPLQALIASVDVFESLSYPEGLSAEQRGVLRELLAGRERSSSDARADTRAAKKVVRSRLAALGYEGGPDFERIASSLVDMGILRPTKSAVETLRGATPAFAEAAVAAAGTLDAIDVARESAERMSSVIKALRVYAHRDQRNEPVVVSLKSQMDSVLTLFADRLEEGGIHVVSDFDELPEYRCLADQIHLVWMNLVSNAVDAIGTSGTLTVRGRISTGGVVVSVGDTGTGIMQEHRTVIFDPFFTTKKDGTGTGLGLSITREIVQSHRGTLSFDSGPQGTTFIVTLPLAGIANIAPPIDFPEPGDA